MTSNAIWYDSQKSVTIDLLDMSFYMRLPRQASLILVTLAGVDGVSVKTIACVFNPTTDHRPPTTDHRPLTTDH
jgi:hypothetical protein